MGLGGDAVPREGFGLTYCREDLYCGSGNLAAFLPLQHP